MKCPNCGYENRSGARFCHRCGTALGTSVSDVSKQPTKPLVRPPDLDLPATRPLAGASVTFAPLPEGALLRERRYEVLEVRTTDTNQNVYLVEDTASVRICPNCRAEVADPEERFCFLCGADLSGVAPLYLRYVVRESGDERAFAQEAQLLEMRLEHPGLLLPRDIFTEAPYGPPRRYRVEPEFSPPLAASLSVPQELNRVLEWGVSLAHALDYLHCHNVVLREVGLNHIAVEDRQARWANLESAIIISPIAASEALAQDVRGLALALFYLATGQAQYTPATALPDGVALLFSQALASPQGFADAATFGAQVEAVLQELRRPASVILAVGHRSDVGQERSLNEDSLLTFDIAPVFHSISAPVGLFAVADGMGGHEAGDVASQLTVRMLAQQAGELLATAAGRPLPDVRQWLTAAVQAANQAVYDRRKAAGTDMGSTLVMALFVNDAATIVNVGDSRAYLLKHDGITQITTDHSLVERLVATGQITPEEAATHPQKNVIYRVIGDKPRVEADLFEHRLEPGQALLLCTDGLSGMVTDEQIWQIWRTSVSPQEACDRLVEAANQAGGEDNISVVIVQVNR